MKTNQSTYKFNDRTMKKIFFFIIIIGLGFSPVSAQVGIGGTPNPNAELDVISTDKGVMLPRMTTNEVATLVATLNLAADPNDFGMVVYNTDENCIQVYTGSVFSCVFVGPDEEAGSAGVVKVNVRGAGNQTAHLPNRNMSVECVWNQ